MSEPGLPKSKVPKWLIVGLFVAIVVYVPIYILVTQLYGIPLWWAFPLNSLSAVPLHGTFIIAVSPDSPTSFGQPITVLVTNSSRKPVWNATVDVIYAGNTVYQPLTNGTGWVAFPYPGEPTQLRVEKMGYDTGFAVIPHAPLQWVREQETAYLVAFSSSGFGAVLGILGTRFFPARKARRKKRVGK